MAKSDTQSSPQPMGAKAKTEKELQRSQRRHELLVEECKKRGLRFLPAQVMRAIYEREGLL